MLLRMAGIPLPESDHDLGTIFLAQTVESVLIHLLSKFHLDLLGLEHTTQEFLGRFGQHPGVAGTHKTHNVLLLLLIMQ